MSARHPTWPLTVLFAGYPLWWLLGMTDLVSVAMTCVMAIALAKGGHLRAPRGFVLWLLFLAWVAVGFLVVHVAAPGSAEPESGGSRYLTWGFRLAWYLQATVIVLFVVNLRKGHSVHRIFRSMGWMFVSIVIGGAIGVVAPHLDFPSLLELVLPRSVSHIPFVKSQIHPNVAELQNDLYGPASSRPSAPFPYANVWGLNYACFLPFFIVGWFSGTSWRRRCVGVVVLALSVVPVIYSLNRGLWAALAVLIVFTMLRSTSAKQVRTTVGLLAVIVVAGLAITVTPLGSQVEHRFGTQNSNDGRSQLTALTFDGMSSTSPVVGFGTTRAVRSSFTSIAVGASAECPLCSPPALGTQGQLSLVAFCQGWGGLIMYYGFLILVLLRHIRLKSPAAVAAVGVLIVHLVTSPVYSADNIAILAVFCAIGVLERIRAAEHTSSLATGVIERSPAIRPGFLKRNRAYVVVPALLCALAGWFLGGHAREATATVSMNVPAEQAYSGAATVPRTLDTEAQLATSQAVAEAVARRTGQSTAEVIDRISVTARPNTRILNVSYRAQTVHLAGDSVSAIATALLQMRQEQIATRQSIALNAIDTRARAIQQGLNTVGSSARLLRDSASAEVRNTKRGLLGSTAYRLYTDSTLADTQRQRVESLPLSPGSLLGPVSYTIRSDRRHTDVASGLVLGMLLGLLAAMARDARGYRVGRASRNGYLMPQSLGVAGAADQWGATAFAPDATYLSVDPELQLAPLATGSGLQGGAMPAADPSKIVLLATSRTRAAGVNLISRRLARAGANVIGMVMAK